MRPFCMAFGRVLYTERKYEAPTWHCYGLVGSYTYILEVWNGRLTQYKAFQGDTCSWTSIAAWGLQSNASRREASNSEQPCRRRRVSRYGVHASFGGSESRLNPEHTVEMLSWQRQTFSTKETCKLLQYRMFS